MGASEVPAKHGLDWTGLDEVAPSGFYPGPKYRAILVTSLLPESLRGRGTWQSAKSSRCCGAVHDYLGCHAGNGRLCEGVLSLRLTGNRLDSVVARASAQSHVGVGNRWLYSRRTLWSANVVCHYGPWARPYASPSGGLVMGTVTMTTFHMVTYRDSTMLQRVNGACLVPGNQKHGTSLPFLLPSSARDAHDAMS